jgi:acetate kinase
MRDLLASSEQAARDAVAIFVYSVSTEIGRLTAALGGLNAVVFMAGIGESAPEVRERVCERLDWLGVDLDDAWNRANETRISTLASPVTVWVLPTDEEGVIAEETLRMTSPGGECFP